MVIAASTSTVIQLILAGFGIVLVIAAFVAALPVRDQQGAAADKKRDDAAQLLGWGFGLVAVAALWAWISADMPLGAKVALTLALVVGCVCIAGYRSAKSVDAKKAWLMAALVLTGLLVLIGFGIGLVDVFSPDDEPASSPIAP